MVSAVYLDERSMAHNESFGEVQFVVTTQIARGAIRATTSRPSPGAEWTPMETKLARSI